LSVFLAVTCQTVGAPPHPAASTIERTTEVLILPIAASYAAAVLAILGRVIPTALKID
jgi:hypothetical protein